MANPYFNATYYLANNPDVFAAGINTAEGAWAHYEQYGAAEALNGVASRSPAPWFDIVYYRAENPDLNTAGLTAGQLFTHFTEYGLAEGRSPSAAAEAVDAESLAAYAAANEDLREAFGIEEGEEPTEAQLILLAKHFYQFGYSENRPGAPVEFNENPGSTFNLTTDIDDFTGTDGDDVFRAFDRDGETLQDFDTLDGGAGDDVLNIFEGGYTAGAAPTIANIETINNAVAEELDLTNVTGLKRVNSTANASYVSASTSTTFAALGAVTGLNIEFTDVADGVVNLVVDADGDVEFTFGATNTDVDAIEVAVASDSDVDLTDASDVQSITVTGAGDTEIANLSTELTLFDASGATGDVTFTSGALTKEAVALGGSGADELDFGDALESVTIEGGAGIDTITGGAGDDTLDGGAGNDTIDGGAGDDIIIGGAGADKLTGGAGKDVFVITARTDSTYTNFDSIIDFTTGEDVIDLSALSFAGATDAITDGSTTTTNEAYAQFVSGVEGFFGDNAVALWTETGGDTYLFADVNGDGNFTADADLVINVGSSTVAIGDLVFA